ncbi:hypothetical protein PA06A_09970 [Cutibacterium acnes P06A]|nr:hypothetical protein H497_09572 [Cutibacterium acnes PA2]MCM4176259.1 hypothetical protein [Cutibacterium acnes P06A]GHT84194.1 hypothetical protein FACS1894129_0400 [Actinomycetota bacterium]
MMKASSDVPGMSTTGWVPFLGLQVKSLVPGTFVPGFFIANLIAEVQLGILGPSIFEGIPSGL